MSKISLPFTAFHWFLYKLGLISDMYLYIVVLMVLFLVDFQYNLVEGVDKNKQLKSSEKLQQKTHVKCIMNYKTDTLKRVSFNKYKSTDLKNIELSGYDNDPKIGILDKGELTFIPSSSGNTSYFDSKALASRKIIDQEINIVGGDPVDITKISSYVMMTITTSFDFYECCGNLISAVHVLTGAHCVTNHETINNELAAVKPDCIKLRVGSNYSDKGGGELKVRHIYVHPDYLKDPLVQGYRDLAVLTLTSKIVFDSTISSIDIHPRLNNNDIDKIAGTKCTVAGTGEPKDNVTSIQLLQIVVTLISPEICKNYYKNRIDPKVHICALDKGKSSSHGDSGGGLICNDKILALVSWGDCCVGTKPVVYARVDNAESFIQQAKLKGDQQNKIFV